MEAAVKIQLTSVQEAKIDAGDVVAVSASWDDFLAFLLETHYRIDYHNGRIIIMGLAAFYHEVLVSTIITLFNLMLKGKGYYIAGSNVGIMQQEGKGYYNPDVTIVKGKPDFRNESTAIISNPYIIIEVLSESTAAYDLYHKLPKYQRIDSLQEVVFVDRFDQSITVCSRTETLNAWTQRLYEKPEEMVRIAADYTISVREFFADLPDEAFKN